ncbi:MAG: SET domain-containing protein-lysine N-methyltransferase [Gemmatimonadaceae bacterium]|nr:SET domain-containing protein-lysine N-methyltransferase [Gemmatimonadaceae bacterium]
MAEGKKKPLYKVRKSGIQGRGVFAARKLRKGQRVIEYAGERISNKEADLRYDDEKMKRHHTFLFTVDGKTVIDGAVGGNDAKLINHSCDPNCEAVIEKKRIFIYALKTIHPGDELVYDYQYERTGENDEEMEKFYKCRCGSENCRGTIMKKSKKRSRR